MEYVYQDLESVEVAEIDEDYDNRLMKECNQLFLWNGFREGYRLSKQAP
jgi:hypothetical protein